MHETADDLRWLQELLDRSHVRMGAHMRAILTPERRLTASQIARYLQGVKHVALADVQGGRVEVYRRPGPSGYDDVRLATRGERLRPLAFPDIEISVDEVIG